MSLDREQKGVVRGIAAAVAFMVLFLAIGYFWGYFWFPVALGPFDGAAGRIAFALKADIFVFVWLLAAVGNVANRRFFSPDDIQGGGLSAPSDQIGVPLSILQNTLEQCVLAVGAHLALAVLLQDREMALIPLFVVLFGVGRAAFWIGYKGGAAGRAFGFACTFYPTAGAYLLAIVLLIAR